MNQQRGYIRVLRYNTLNNIHELVIVLNTYLLIKLEWFKKCLVYLRLK